MKVGKRIQGGNHAPQMPPNGGKCGQPTSMRAVSGHTAMEGRIPSRRCVESLRHSPIQRSGEPSPVPGVASGDAAALEYLLRTSRSRNVGPVRLDDSDSRGTENAVNVI